MSESIIQVLQPVVGQDELLRISNVLESKWLGKGQVVTDFEAQFAQHVGAHPQQVISTTCGTEAIFLAGDVFNFREGEEILVPSISFIAVGSSVVTKRARLVLCDVDRRSLNVTVDNLRAKMSSRTKAVILTHYGGYPCDMDPIIDLCRSRGIQVIEDSACATSSRYKGRACGTLADMGLWSFEAGKIITTGDGGMLYFKSQDHIRIAKEYLYLGIAGSEKSGTDRAVSGNSSWWEVQIERPGRRAIMNNVAAAIGLAQLQHIRDFVTRRKTIDHRYRSELASCPGITLPPLASAETESSYYFFWIQLERRDELAWYLREHGVYSTFRYWPLHKVRYFQQSAEGLLNAEYASRHTLNLPLHHGLSDDDVTKVIELVKRFGDKR
jgi:dTDP-4-amino-4,6-dideoxygalactose transaminase